MNAEAGGFNDPARTDPEKLAAVRDDLLAAVGIGEHMTPLLAELAALSEPLGSLALGQELAFSRIKVGISGLQREVERAFSGMAERADNPVYLGNLAASRHLREIEGERAARDRVGRPRLSTAPPPIETRAE